VAVEDATMSKMQYLEDQLARAERLRKGASDAVTVARIQAFAEECRQQINAIMEGQTISKVDRC
jgi:hypothetical protein